MRKALATLSIPVVTFAVMLVGANQANAAGAGTGLVTGIVKITSPAAGIPVANATPVATSYEFSSTIISGLIGGTDGTDTVTYDGFVNVTANGGSPSENANGGSGTVNITALSAGVDPVTGSGPVTTGGDGTDTISGNLSGSFTREGTHVHVVLTGSVTINGVTINGVTIVVEAEFVPTNGNGVTTEIKEAQFAGSWTAAAV